MTLKNLTPEEEEKLINKLAEEIVKRELELPASLLLEVYSPVSGYFTTLGFFYGFPFISMLGDTGFDYTSLFMKRENVKKLINKIEEKKKERDEKKQRKEKGRSLLDWIRGKRR